MTILIILCIIFWTLVGIMTKVSLDQPTSESFHKVFTCTRIGAIILTGITILESLI